MSIKTVSIPKAYGLLLKPGIIAGNLVTMLAGFALASKGTMDPVKCLGALLGLSFLIGSACVFNNYIDCAADEKMTRTKERARAKEALSSFHMLLLGTLLGMLGTISLAFFSKPLALIIALSAFAIYVLFYSFFKYHSAHATLIGSLAGAAPPLVGYAAVSGHLDASAWTFFALIALWQMPHFYAIALYRLEDYKKAAIPVLPIKQGVLTTKIHMLFYIIAFIGAAFLLAYFADLRPSFLAVSLAVGFAWLVLCLRGLFRCPDELLWARKMFLFSLIVVMSVSLMLFFIHA